MITIYLASESAYRRQMRVVSFAATGHWEFLAAIAIYAIYAIYAICSSPLTFEKSDF